MDTLCHIDVGKVIKDLKRFFYTEAIAETLLEWIVNKEKYDRQQTIDYISVIFRTGLPAAIRQYSDVAK